MDYSKLSDQEINRLVARQFPETYLFNEEGNPYQLIPDSMAAYSGSDFDEVDFQPCGNPADAWPIIDDNQISIIFNWNEEGLHGATNQPWISSENANPLRAAMECFLMIKESANVQDNPA